MVACSIEGGSFTVVCTLKLAWYLEAGKGISTLRCTPVSVLCVQRVGVTSDTHQGQKEPRGPERHNGFPAGYPEGEALKPVHFAQTDKKKRTSTQYDHKIPVVLVVWKTQTLI